MGTNFEWHDEHRVSRAESLSTGTDESVGEHPVTVKIRQGLLPIGADNSEQFLPHSQLEQMLSVDDIKSVLKDANSSNGHPLEPIDVERDIVPMARNSKQRIKIFTVLILIEMPGYIGKFIKKRVWDDALPLDSRHRVFKRKRKSFADRFCHWQWAVLAPIIDFTTMKHCTLNHKIRMPFLDRRNSPVLEGAHGRVSKIRIHDDHQKRRHLPTQDSYPYYAIKQLKLEDDDTFEKERDALARFSGPGKTHHNLIELLFSYQHGSEKYLIFPWAQCNLWDFWQKENRKLPSSSNFFWLLQQCRGLAEGLCKVHEKDSKDISGRHGDIKPQNILYFEGSGNSPGRFVLADFTLMRFHGRNATNTDANKVGFSRTYRPPEVEEKRISATQKYDIWTLGCVYLEFVSWHLLGYDAIGESSFRHGTLEGRYESFSTARQSDDDKRHTLFVEDKFYSNDEERASVKNSVYEWVAFLKNHQHASPALRAFLDLIMRRMLVPNPNNRCRTERLLSRMEAIISDCHNRRDCYSLPGHRDPRETIPDTYFPRPFTNSSKYGKVFMEQVPADGESSGSQSQTDLELITTMFLGSENKPLLKSPGENSPTLKDRENRIVPFTGEKSQAKASAEVSAASFLISGPGRTGKSLHEHLVSADSRLETLSSQETNFPTTPNSNGFVASRTSLAPEIEQHDAPLENEAREGQGNIGQRDTKPWTILQACGKAVGRRGRRLLSSGGGRLEAWKDRTKELCRRLR